MDTIRRKIYGLHSELAEALFNANRAQESSESLSQRAKDLEIKQRDLMKKIANKENDLDEMQEKLEKSEKSYREKDELLETAKADEKSLKESISLKEEQLRKTSEAGQAREKELEIVSARGDQTERSRKEVEHRVQMIQDCIQKLEKDLLEARYLTDEATRKHDEAVFKIEKLRESIGSVSKRGDAAEKKLAALENDLKVKGQTLSIKLTNKEKLERRIENLKWKVKYMSDQVREAEHRADLEEQEQERWEGKAKWLRSKVNKK